MEPTILIIVILSALLIISLVAMSWIASDRNESDRTIQRMIVDHYLELDNLRKKYQEEHRRIEWQLTEKFWRFREFEGGLLIRAIDEAHGQVYGYIPFANHGDKGRFINTVHDYLLKNSEDNPYDERRKEADPEPVRQIPGGSPEEGGKDDQSTQ